MIHDYDEFLSSKGATQQDFFQPLPIYEEGNPWYDETNPQVTRKQIQLMKSYGIDYVIYDSYWEWKNGKNRWGPYSNRVLENFVSLPDDESINFSIFWANRFTSLVLDLERNRNNPNGCDGFLSTGGGLEQMAKYWGKFLQDPRYEKIDGKPVFYIYYPGVISEKRYGAPEDVLGKYSNNIHGICDACAIHNFFPKELQSDNERTRYFLQRFSALLRKYANNTFDEVYFVGVINAFNKAFPNEQDYWLIQHPEAIGLDAITSYGYKYFDKQDMEIGRAGKYSYKTMQKVYRKYYRLLLEKGKVNYQVPVTVGWNRAPFHKYEGKGTAENWFRAWPQDNARSEPQEFLVSLREAKNQVQNHPQKTDQRVIVCCWNEYAEGSFIEPSKAWGYQFLEAIQEVFESP